MSENGVGDAGRYDGAGSQGWGWQPNTRRGTPEWLALESTLGEAGADALRWEPPTPDTWSFKARGLPPLSEAQEAWAEKARAAAQEAGIDPNLFARQMWQESGFDPDVIYGRRDSPKGARGIAQIMPEYHPNVDPLNPDEALAYAAHWMRQLTDRYGDPRRALLAYNGGGGAVQGYDAGEFSDPQHPE